ncbi:MAG: 3-oxoacyl-[acyl-carrier-protein] synthase II [Candidatus Latescibacterota bacterium]|jgi:3-oxoacyl-[acyl-carrier-protein] synthase II
MKRVVITGIGAFTSIGTGCQDFWKALLSGQSGISPVESFDTSKYAVHVGGEIKAFSPASYIKTLEAQKIGRTSQLGIAAAKLALEDAQVDMAALDLTRAAISMGTTSGEPNQIEQFDDYFVADNLQAAGDEMLTLYPCHHIAAYMAAELQFMGRNTMIPAACAAGTYAISHAFDMLRLGQADLALAGGADSFSRITYSGFAQLKAIAPERCQPFDKNRKGMIPAEGAGVLVLEPLERALARNARIYAEIAGCGLSCDAFHMTGGHPEEAGSVKAMENALFESGVQREEISYISAHGTGTPTNDMHETRAVKKVFGNRSGQVPISSIKSMLGHTMGAASAIETAVCALAAYTDRIPPTINLDESDPECDLDYVPNEAREHKVFAAMNNAYAFGGVNASLIVKKFKDAC